MNPILALIITNVIWGMASPIFKFSLTNIPPFTLAFIRFFLAAIIFLPFVFKKWQRMSGHDFFLICLAGFFGIAINISFFFLGLGKTESINAPIIGSSGPVFIYLLSVLFLHEKAKIKVLSGMLLALLGVLLIILSPIFLDGRTFVIGAIEGNIFFIFATLGSVMNTILTKRISRNINPYQITMLGFLFGSLFFLPFIPQELSSWSFSQLNINGWVGIIYGVIFSSAIAYFLHVYAIQKLAAQEVGLFMYIDPIAAVILAIFLVNEYPNIYFVLGSLLVFIGIFMAEKRIHWHPINRLKI